MRRRGVDGNAQTGIEQAMNISPSAIVADGKKLEAQWIGGRDGEGPVLVFLHEGLGCIALWRDFPEKLCAATQLSGFVYSRAGYGGSHGVALPRATDFMHHEATVVLPQVLAAAGIKQAILVGHSDGGSISLIYAGQDISGRLRGVITLAAHVFNEPMCVEEISRAKQAYDTGDLRQRLCKYHGDNVDNAFRGWNDVWLDEKFLNWNIEEFLPSISVPALILQGENDPYGSAAQVEAIVAGIGENAKSRFIPGCRHSPHLENSEVTLDLCRDFVTGLVHS